MPVADLIDRGVKLYMAGRIREAREAFQLAVDLDPANEKARSYLLQIRIRESVATASAAPDLSRVAAVVETALDPDAVPLPPPAAARAAAQAGPAPQPEAAPAAPGAAPPPPEAEPASPGPVPLPPPAARASAAGAPDPDPPAQPAAAAPGPSPSPRPPASAAALAAAVEVGDPDEGQGDWAPSPWDDGPAASTTIELEPTGGLDLQAVAEKSDLRPLVPEGAPAADAAPQPKSDVDVWLSAAKELFALGDFTGSLELIEKILQVDPDHGEARDYLRQNEATLVSMYESKLAPLTRIPRLAIKAEEVMWLNLDHRAGFLLAQIDGTVDYETLFALSGLPRLDTARILANLIAEGVVTS